MRIDVTGDDSISHQARAYAEYHLFAVLSTVVDTSRVRRASLALRRGRPGRRSDTVLCAVAVELKNGDAIRLRACGDHPLAAINRAVERIRLNASPVPHDSTQSEMAVAE